MARRGAPKANGPWPEGSPDEPKITTYGGATDRWGATWTATEINASSFGVSVNVNGQGTGFADSLGVTVYYCP